MNERIWELASKSGFDVSADGKFGNYSQMYKIEKFAELIVRECIDCLETLSRDHSMVGAAQDTIREHFGVEL